MKQQLDPGTRAAMVDYRLERAHSTLGEADLLYGSGYFNSVKTQLSMHFVRNNRLNLEHSTTFGLLFDTRHSSDYSDFAYCDAPLVDLLRPRAEAFILAVEALTREKKTNPANRYLLFIKKTIPPQLIFNLFRSVFPRSLSPHSMNNKEQFHSLSVRLLHFHSATASPVYHSSYRDRK